MSILRPISLSDCTGTSMDPTFDVVPMLSAMASRSPPLVALAAATALRRRPRRLRARRRRQPTAPPAPAPAACTKASLKTKTAGQADLRHRRSRRTSRGSPTTSRTTARASRARWPYAVATKLGYAKDRGDVDPGHRSTTRSRPGPKAFDFDINEFSITDERKQAVDFSAPYYDVTQAVIALKTSKIAGAKSLADLKDAKLGAQVGTTSYRAITELIKPTSAAAGLQQQRRRQEGAAERPDRRPRGGPADGVLHHLGRDRDAHDRRPAAAAVGHAGAVRPGAGQGLPADRLRQQAVDRR